jgi:hypothetical protein
MTTRFFSATDRAQVPVSDSHKDSLVKRDNARSGADYWWFVLAESYRVESAPIVRRAGGLPTSGESPPIRPRSNRRAHRGGLSPEHRAAISRGLLASPHVSEGQRRRRARERAEGVP